MATPSPAPSTPTSGSIRPPDRQAGPPAHIQLGERLILTFASLALALSIASATVTSARAAPLPSGRLDRLAMTLAGRLGPALEGRRVPVQRVLLQVRLPPGHYATGLARLARLMAGLIQSRVAALGLRAVVLASPRLDTPALLARARREHFDLALRVEVVETERTLHLRGRLYAVHLPLWERLRTAPARLLSALHASAPKDAELRAYLGRPGRPDTVSCTGKWFPLDRWPYFTVALGDVDGDGRAEVVLAGQTVLRVLRWSPVYHRFDRVARGAVPGASAPAHPRLPLVSLALADLNGDRRADIVLRSARRTAATALTVGSGGRLGVLRQLDGYPVGALRTGHTPHLAVLHARAGRAELSGRSLRFVPPLPRGWRTRLPLPRRLLRALLTRSPQPGRAVLGAVSPDARIRLYALPGGRRIATIGPVGVAFALGDLTGDGRLELVSTATTPLEGRDTLTVRHLPGGRPICGVPDVPGAITAVTVGDALHQGRAQVVAAVWSPATRRSHLLVVR